MDIEQDYLMRMIKQMIKALISVLLGKENPTYELPLEEQYKSFEGFYHDLIDMVNAGKINEAENLLYDKLDYADKKDVCDAITFYGYLNSLDDSFLEENDYTREEINLGLKNIASMIGMESVIEVFGQEL